VTLRPKPDRRQAPRGLTAEASWQTPLPVGWEFTHKVAEFATSGLTVRGYGHAALPDVPTLLRNRPVPNCTPCRDHGAILGY